MTVTTDDAISVTPQAVRHEMIAFAIMAVLLLAVPFSGIYPYFVMQALCFALLPAEETAVISISLRCCGLAASLDPTCREVVV